MAQPAAYKTLNVKRMKKEKKEKEKLVPLSFPFLLKKCTTAVTIVYCLQLAKSMGRES